MKDKKEPEKFHELAEKLWKKYGIFILPFILVIVFFNLFSPLDDKQEFDYNKFVQAVQEGKIKSVIVKVRDNTYIIDGELRGIRRPDDTFTKSGKFSLLIPKEIEFEENQKLISFLRKHGIKFTIEEQKRSIIVSLLFSMLPIILIIAFLLFFMKKQIEGASGKAFTFGKSKAKLFTGNQGRITFKDVAGIEEAKEELEEIIEFLKDPQKIQKLGGKIPKGVLIVGDPGCGKTLLARAVAGEANVPFFSVSGSDFVEMFVGVGASRVRDLFEIEKKDTPCLIFIDELDAIGRQRGAGLGGSHDEREQTLNQLLVEMDGFDQNQGVIILAATNRPDILDKALLRPGRFDRRVVVPMPDVKGREAILKVHIRKIPLAKDVSLKIIARSTPGFSGADLANLVNEAALIAARHEQDKVTMKDIEYAKDKMLMGVERKSIVMNKKEKKNTAYHEAGHALVAVKTPEADPIHKVTIIPRGIALGITQQLPLEDRYTYSKDYLEAQLTVLLAGRESEELFLDKTTTGASNDFERATEIARKMICQWGMSDLGLRSFESKEEYTVLGRDLAKQKPYSEKTAQCIDDEITKILKKAQNQAKKILEENKDQLESLAKLLLEKETLSGKEVKKLLKIKAAQ